MEIFQIKDLNFKNRIKYPDMQLKNETTFLCGESGSGKSTLLKLLNGVLSPHSGSITYQGTAIDTMDPIKLRREVLLVGQTVYLFDKSIRENFHEYYAYRDLPPPSDGEINRYLDICALSMPLDSMCNLLSGGERQRVFLGLNLSLQPKVLMLDEPTSALDEKTADALMENICAHCKERGITLLVVSHDRAIAEKYADRVINLEGGGVRE